MNSLNLTVCDALCDNRKQRSAHTVLEMLWYLSTTSCIANTQKTLLLNLPNDWFSLIFGWRFFLELLLASLIVHLWSLSLSSEDITENKCIHWLLWKRKAFATDKMKASTVLEILWSLVQTNCIVNIEYILLIKLPNDWSLLIFGFRLLLRLLLVFPTLHFWSLSLSSENITKNKCIKRMWDVRNAWILY